MGTKRDEARAPPFPRKSWDEHPGLYVSSEQRQSGGHSDMGGGTPCQKAGKAPVKADSASALHRLSAGSLQIHKLGVIV